MLKSKYIFVLLAVFGCCATNKTGKNCFSQGQERPIKGVVVSIELMDSIDAHLLSTLATPSNDYLVRNFDDLKLYWIRKYVYEKKDISNIRMGDTVSFITTAEPFPPELNNVKELNPKWKRFNTDECGSKFYLTSGNSFYR